MRHVYSVVRYVPNVASGERVNIGMVAGSDDTGEWLMRIADDRTRALQLGGGLNTVTAVFDGMKEIADGVPGEGSEAWLKDLHDKQRGVVQFSPLLPVDAENAAAAIAMLWPGMIYGDASTGEARSLLLRMVDGDWLERLEQAARRMREAHARERATYPWGGQTGIGHEERHAAVEESKGAHAALLAVALEET